MKYITEKHVHISIDIHVDLGYTMFSFAYYGPYRNIDEKRVEVSAEDVNRVIHEKVREIRRFDKESYCEAELIFYQRSTEGNGEYICPLFSISKKNRPDIWEKAGHCGLGRPEDDELIDELIDMVMKDPK